MTTYEILLLLDPEQAEAHQEELVARLRALVEGGGGTWRSHDAWGRRRLAYEIGKKSEGVYHLVVFESSADDARRDRPRAEDRRRRAAADGDPAHRGLAHERAARGTPRWRQRPRPAAVVPSVEYAEAPKRTFDSDEEV